MHYIPHQRLRALLLASLIGAVAVTWVGLDVRARRAHEAERASQTRAVVSLLGFADLALSSDARWLRHPGQTEPGAPFADLPGAVDIDPAGSALGPPRAILAVGAGSLVVIPREAP